MASYTNQINSIMEGLGISTNLPDNLVSTKLNSIIELLGGECDSKLLSKQLDAIIEWLPFYSAYQRIEYIESTGTQYIDTLFKPTNNTSAEIRMTIVEPKTFGTYMGTDNNFKIQQYESDGSSICYRFGGTTLWYTNAVQAARETKVSCKKNNFYVDDVLLGTAECSPFTSTENLLIFCGRNFGEIQTNRIPSIKLFRAKVWDNETLVRDFIPCIRRSDSVAGLYDAVNKVFYTNSGTGSFVVPT